MARTYGKIHVAIWKDPDYRTLTMGEQWLYEALVSQPDLSLCGLIIYRPGRWSKLCANLTTDELSALLGLLEDKRYLVIDWNTEEVLIRSFCRNDGGAKHSKILVGIISAITLIESDTLRAAAQAELDRALNEEGTDADSDASSSPTDADSDVNGLPIDADSIGNRLPIDPQPPQLAASSSSVQLTADSEQLQPANAAAAALDLYIEYRLNTQPGIRSKRRYSETVRNDETVVYGLAMATLAAAGKTPRQIIETIYGISQADLARHTNGRRAS